MNAENFDIEVIRVTLGALTRCTMQRGYRMRTSWEK